MIVYFNNCHGRDHVRIYGIGAFYDLDTVGLQATKAKNLRVGQKCIVVSPSIDGQIVFNWFSFLRETLMPDDTGTFCRVFFGTPIKSEILLKVDAAREQFYSMFFDKNGNFKRQSIIQK